MVDIKKLQSLLFDDDADEEDEVGFTADQPLAHENTTQITIDPDVFAEPEESEEVTEEAEEQPVLFDEVFAEPAEEETEEEADEEPAEEPVFAEEEEPVTEEETEFAEEVLEDIREEIPEETVEDIPEETVEDIPEVIPEVTEEAEEEEPKEFSLGDAVEEEISVFDEPEEAEESIEDKIDAIVFGDPNDFSDIDDLFAQFAAATDLEAIEEPVPEEPEEEVVFPSDPVPEEEPAEEAPVRMAEEAEELVIDVPEAQPEEPAEEAGATTNIVDFFSDISREDIPENVVNEKTVPLDLDAILGTQDDTEKEEEPAEKIPAEEPVPEPVREEPKPKKKEYTYYFQPIISPLFGTDLSESQTTKKSGEDVHIIVTSNIDVHDDAPTEILDTRAIKDEE